MSERSPNRLSTAVADFRRLRRQADVERLLARLTGDTADLLNFEEVRRKLRATATSARHLREIPLDAIVGSVGRYQDFSRSFLPRNNSDEGRWARVLLAADELAGLPPIEVYQIGDAYFVLDGNHRVSVARQNGAKSIQAYVMPFRTRVPIGPGIRPDELILRAEQAAFLEQTRLDENRPQANLILTAPGQYERLREHIDVHRHYLGLEQQREIPLEDAAASWLDTVYQPLVQLIHERGMLHEFPGRTETDLYLWLTEHRAELEQQLGWSISLDQAVSDLIDRSGPARPEQIVQPLIEMVLPGEPDPASPAARRPERGPNRHGWLFDEILVPISGEPAGWMALEQAITIARVEGGQLYGLHVVPSEEARSRPDVQALQAEFARRCAEAGVAGQLAVDVGPTAATIRSRSRWADLVVLQVSYPPGPTTLQRLRSGLRSLIRSSIRPVLAVPHVAQRLQRLLLAYDGSAKANEALALATYLAGRWRCELCVATVAEDSLSTEGLRIQARAYLRDHGVTAEFMKKAGPTGEALVAAAAESGSDVIVMGGYGHNTVSDLMLGSAVEDVLRARLVPVLICQ